MKAHHRFLKAFTPIKPTTRTLCNYFFEKNPLKTRELRIDTLSQMLSIGNVRPGARMMVVDMSGLLVASLLERMRGIGEILNMIEHEYAHLEIPKHLNYPQAIMKMVQNYPWTRIEAQENESNGCFVFTLRLRPGSSVTRHD